MSSCVIAAPESVTVRSVAAFGRDLAVAFDAGEAISLDIDPLVEADLSFLQLLHAARAHLAAQGKSIRLARPAGPAVASLLARAGFLADPAPADVDFWFHGDLPR